MPAAYENHLNSKRHKELVLQFGDAEHELIASKVKPLIEAKVRMPTVASSY